MEQGTGTENCNQRTLVGQPSHGYWIYSSNPPSYDLTRPAPPHYPLPAGHESITLHTGSTPITISLAKTALIVVDMQNFFLSPALGRQVDGPGNKAKRILLDFVLPAAAAAEIQMIWLNEDIDQMPPSTLNNFGNVRETASTDILSRLDTGLGADLGQVTLEDGTFVQAGRTLMRNSWSADLPSDLKSWFRDDTNPPHIWSHQNRTSGLWHPCTPFAQSLKQKGICTLLFAGVNTDQCVGGTLQDAYYQGYDCILLSDACGTTSPQFATQGIEYNVGGSWGFVSDSQSLKNGIEMMLQHKDMNA